MIRRIFIALSLLLLTACQSIPEGVTPVTEFDEQRYLGKWYEIARLDHSFERDLSNVTAEYSLREDGGIRVLNRGYKAEDKEWSEAEGRAYFVGTRDTAHLEVSFFGPFFSSYVVFELGEEYDYAFVSGYNTDYLWLLARTPTVSDQVMADFLALAEEKGFNFNEIIFPVQQ
ncbi:lipocalin family protein [Enterovibrio sp. ZSDZ42]|uniref:Outer membrane lipoprotein Blc n=1 Tax=Enterovibrio gelatinilyticus TaxID=2899819 RepID=A0ABT5R345_9GAMM|nr:lipocalin family protein [Enterovibrio sp. ZSDZ42]MDD1794686.1 lipocalin family protein [Enterovibrio sp. ZSDZ42]